MSLTESQLQELSNLIDTFQSLPETAREPWLRALPDGQAAYRDQLRQLLEADAGPETADFLSTLPRVAGFDIDFAGGLQAGMEIGAYRLISELGRGGMGTVWLAERTDGTLKRPVALKLPHGALASRQLAERFSRERDILAALNHSHIARLYDAGVTPQGQPYLALEVVSGAPLPQYCDGQSLDIPARLALFAQVLSAVQYAHGQLIVHRDLKPSNILVAADGEVKLLDFGIAKMLTEGQARETELTQAGGRALTPDYASPEQIAGLPIGTASDVYSLGVVLYELLTGSRPYRLSRESRGALEDAILSADAPRPSEATMSEDSARARGSTPKKLRRQLEGDLDTIILKALKKNPAERYGTVDALAQDLARFLRGDAVLARPDSAWYRARKFVGRNTLAVGTGATLATVIVVAGGIAIWQASIAREQSRIARTEAATAKAAQGFLLELFEANSTVQADPQAAQKLTARELLDRGAERVDKALQDSPESAIGVLNTLANMYFQLNLTDQASRLQQRRVALARKAFGAQDERTAAALLDYVDTLQEGTRRAEIPPLLDEALAIFKAAGTTSTYTRGSALITSAQYWRYESLARAMAAADEAIAFYRRDAPGDAGLVSVLTLAARARITADNAVDGRKLAEQALDAARALGPQQAAFQLTPMSTLSDALIADMQFRLAESHRRENISLGAKLQGADHPDTLRSMISLANLLLTVGRTAEGEAMLRQVRAAMRPDDPRTSPESRAFMNGLLHASMAERGRPDQQLAALKAEVNAFAKALPNSPVRSRRESQLAEVQALLGDTAAAMQTADTADTHWRAFARDAGPQPGDAGYALARARVLLAAGDASSALKLLDPAMPAAPATAIARQINHSRARLMLAQHSEALAAADAALSRLAQQTEGERPVSLQAHALHARGAALAAMHDFAGAAASLDSALQLHRANDLPGSIWLEQSALALAAVREAQGRKDLATPLRAEAARAAKLRRRG